MTAILNAIGVSSDRPPGIDVSGRVAFDRHGNQLASFDYPQYLTSWSSLFNLLHSAFPPQRYHLGIELLDIRQTDDGAVALLSSGEQVAADLVVGADGIRSRVRGLLAPDIVPSYGGYVAWRGIMDETDLSAAFMAETFDRFSFCFPPGGQFIGYPLLGQRRLQRERQAALQFSLVYPCSRGRRTRRPDDRRERPKARVQFRRR